MTANSDIAKQITLLKQRLDAIDKERGQIAERLKELEKLRAAQSTPPTQVNINISVTMAASTAAKIALFRSFFRGREDVFPRR